MALQFVSDRFYEVYEPNIEDSFVKHTELDGIRVDLEIVDIASDSDLPMLADQHVRLSKKRSKKLNYSRGAAF